MKREHKSESYIDWLKSLGCVFYCKFDENYGTDDLINNVPLTLSGQGVCTYDTQEQGFYIKTPNSVGYAVGFWNNGVGGQLFQNNNLTSLQTVKKITNTSSKQFMFVMQNTNNINYQYSISAVGNTGSYICSNWPIGIVNTARVMDSVNNQYRLYSGGVQFNSVPMSNYPYENPINWVSQSGLLLGNSIRSDKTNTEYYFYDYYIFNTVLDLTTIRKIQGYE